MTLGHRPLNPNELQASLRLLAYLASSAPPPPRTTSDNSSSSSSSNRGGGSSGSSSSSGQQQLSLQYWRGVDVEGCLVVPTAGGQLAGVGQVVGWGVGGSRGTAAAAAGGGGGRLLGRLDPRSLQMVHPQLPEHVAR